MFIAVKSQYNAMFIDMSQTDLRHIKLYTIFTDQVP